MKNVLYLSVGDREFTDYTLYSINSLRRNGYKGFIKVIHDDRYDIVRRGKNLGCLFQKVPLLKSDDKFSSRFYKTRLYEFSNFEENLFLDCDTVVNNNIEGIWRYISNDSIAMGLDVFSSFKKNYLSYTKHVDPKIREENEETKKIVEFERNYFNSGVIAWRRSVKIRTLFELWHTEWLK